MAYFDARFAQVFAGPAACRPPATTTS